MKAIFFSWQSDIKPVRNKLKSALEIAAKRISKELEEADRPEIDSDTQGTFGSEDIFNTILEKIDDATLFVADVTPIAITETKLIPNPNVMTELGYALKTKGKSTRLFIYCTEEPVVIEKMPFDIRGKSLMGFSSTDSPAKIADQLVPILEGMLANATPSNGHLEHPYVYISGASFQRWSDNVTVSLSIKNTEPDEYFLEKVKIEGNEATPNRSLAANGITQGISVLGVSQIFETEQPFVHMTLSRAGRQFYIKQEVKVVKGADERNHFVDFVQKPIIVDSFDALRGKI
jgi:hypothetical protein